MLRHLWLFSSGFQKLKHTKSCTLLEEAVDIIYERRVKYIVNISSRLFLGVFPDEYPKYEVIFKSNAPQGEIPVGLNNENEKHDSSQGEHIERNVHGAALIHTAVNMFLPILPCLVIVSLLMFPKVELNQVPA